jgi:hypothetical protein
MLKRNLCVIALVLVASAVASPTSTASGVFCEDTLTGRVCDVVAGTEGSRKPQQNSGADASTGSRDGATRTCTFDGRPIDCTASDGTWSNQRQCWVRRLAPQPPQGDPRWEGHTEGAVYACRPPGAGEGGTAGGATGGGAYTFWAPPGDGTPELVDPIVLAERAVDQMALRAPRVAATPLDPGAPLLVGMDAWFWLAQDEPRDVGPLRRTVTAGPVSVTAEARVTSVVWQTGDGATVVCSGPGTPWTPERGTGPSPTCGHRYEASSAGEPEGAFRLRATTQWQVDWAGAGQSGTITFTMTGARPLRVIELQVLQSR